MRSHSSKGAVLLNVLFASAILTATVGVVGQYFYQMMKMSQRTGAAAAADRIHGRLERSAATAANLKRSADRVPGSPLHQCLYADGAICQTNVWFPIELHASDDSLLAGPEGGAPTVARWDVDEQPCSASPVPTPYCPFVTEAAFRAATCDGAAPCDRGRDIELRITLRLPTDPATGKQVRIRGAEGPIANRVTVLTTAAPGDIVSAKTFRGAPVDAREIAAGGDRFCADGAVFGGIDRYGKMICNAKAADTPCANRGHANKFVSQVDFENAKYNCSDLAFAPAGCAASQFLRGYDSNGNSQCADLSPIIDSVVTEEVAKVVSTFTQFDCPDGTLAFGTYPGNSLDCKRLEFKLGTNGVNGPGALGHHDYQVNLSFTPMNAVCMVQADTWIGLGGHWGACRCEVTQIGPGPAVIFSTDYNSGAVVDPNGHSCGFQYIIVGRVNNGNPNP